MTAPAAGDTAPDFELATGSGARLRLADMRGRTVVLYFYPKDNTQACTLEAKEFSALKDEFGSLGAVVVGVSPDSVTRHANFARKQALSIDLAADVDLAAANAYGVWVEKSMYGRSYMGVERATFVIDARGRIVRIWRKVKAAGHAAEVLAFLRSSG
ncbi:MAG: peroxiredoxin [Rhizobiaceae bacterium]|nr:peroxiredoxin [Rhizobiaceae bacterium]